MAGISAVMPQQHLPQRPAHTVFVGNIPYQTTEQHVIGLCEEIGPVVSFKMVLDKDNGKPKGYGFCEYPDEETALSACRNLSGVKIGARPLRVNMSSKAGTSAPPPITPQVGGPGLVAGSTPTPNDNDRLVLHLARNYSQEQLCVIIDDMYALAREDKERADHYFALCPQLPNSLLQALDMAPKSAYPSFSLTQVTPTVQKPMVDEKKQLHENPITADATHSMETGEIASGSNACVEQPHQGKPAKPVDASPLSVSPSAHFDPTHHPSKRARLQNGWIAKDDTGAGESTSTVSTESDDSIPGIQVHGVLPFSADVLSYLLDKTRGNNCMRLLM